MKSPLCCLATSKLLPIALGWADQASFTPLGDLPGGEFHSVAFAVSANGSVVVGEAQNENGNQAFYWTAESGLVGLGQLPGGTGATAYGISGDGQVVCGAAYRNGTSEGFRWTASTGMVSLGTFPGGSESFALGISSDGNYIAGASQPNYEGFRWDILNGLVGVGDIPGGGLASYAYGISRNGMVIVGVGSDGSGQQPYRWTEVTGILPLANLPTVSMGGARAVSADGMTIVGYSGSQACMWRQSGVAQGLGDLAGGAFDSAAFGVSGDGSAIVGHSITGWGEEAFVWDVVRGMRDLRAILIDEYGLDLSQWRLQNAYAISEDSTAIVGVGLNPGGNTEAWLVRLPAAPCARTDLNIDRVTDLSDLTLFLGHFGECMGDERFLAAADIDRRGCVDLPDLTLLLADFGNLCE